jgi:hypothetical protein
MAIKIINDFPEILNKIRNVNTLFKNNPRVLFTMLVFAPIIIIGCAMWDRYAIGFYDVYNYIFLCFWEYCLFWMGMWFGIYYGQNHKMLG